MSSNGKVPGYTDSKEQLIKSMAENRGEVDGGYFPLANAILDIKGQEGIERHTQRLVRATYILALATIALVLATAGLVYATLHPSEQKPIVIVKEVPQSQK